MSDNKDVSYSQGDDEEYTSEDEYQEDDGSSSEEEIGVTLENEKGNAMKQTKKNISDLGGEKKSNSELKDIDKKNKSLKSPKSKEARIKQYTSKIGESGIMHIMSGEVTDAAKLLEITKSDMGGFKPKSPVKFKPVVWDDNMLKNSVPQQPNINTEDVQSGKVLEPEVAGDDSLPSHEDNDDLSMLEPKPTSTPKVVNSRQNLF